MVRLKNRCQSFSRSLADLISRVCRLFECRQEFSGYLFLKIFQRGDSDIQIAHLTERTRDLTQLFQNMREAAFAEVRHEVSQRTAQAARSDTHRVDPFGIGPIQCVLLKPIQLLKPGEEDQPYAGAGGGVAINALDSFSLCHRVLLKRTPLIRSNNSFPMRYRCQSL